MSTEHTSPDEPTAFRPPEEQPTLAGVQLTPGTILGNRYRIVQRIGAGGMGQVYRADDLKLGQAVALKFLTRRGDARRLYEEVRIGRQISHPNVCRLYDIAEVDGQIFITMEFVDGEDLASLLRRIGAVPYAKAIQIAREIALGLAAAQEKRVIHRDLKPANVMIDGNGRARVTDFGIAVSEVVESEVAGTPAYMAPEQIARGEATFKSDIYSFGLVLFEIFRGRRLFDKNRITSDTDSRSVAREVQELPAGIRPLVVRCLDDDPSARPDIAEVLRSLPGGDALQAAVDAGETPSPEMVAAAQQTGELRLTIAAPLLATALIGLLFVIASSHQTMLYHLVPLPKPPVALAERARDLIEKFGYADPAGDSAYIFSMRAGVIHAIETTDHSTQRWRKLQSVDVPAIEFLYRQSPSVLIPWNRMTPVDFEDPPFTVSGMVNLTLDPRGRLMSFAAVPPASSNPAPPYRDWNGFLAETGVDAKTLQPVAPVHAAPIDTDAKLAWLGRKGVQAVRIEAGSFHGRPVWFSIFSPSETSRGGGFARSLFTVSATPASALLTAFILTTAGLLARRNVKRGRGDRSGALRLAIALMSTMLLAFIFRDSAPAHRFAQALEGICFAGVTVWLVYLALEPYVRRRWPRLLIGWTRLISGRWRDPMVGRDLLIGAAAGVAWVLLRRLLIVSPTWFGEPPLVPESSYLSAISSPRHAIFLLMIALTFSIFLSMVVVLMFLVFRAVFRRDEIALAIIFVLGTLFAVVSRQNPSLELTFAAAGEIIVIFVFWRYGVLALMTTAFIGLALLYAPLTLDPSAWYFGRSLIFVVTVIAVASYGFLTAIAGRRVIPELRFD